MSAIYHHGGSKLHYALYNENPIHTAAKQRNFQALQELISENKGYVHELDGRGNTPLHTLLSDVCTGESCRNNAPDCVQLLLDAGAGINVRNKDDHVPLFLAVKNDWHECAMVLLRHSPSPETTMTVRYVEADEIKEKSLAIYATERLPNALNALLDNAVSREVCNENGEDVLNVDFSCLLQYPNPTKLGEGCNNICEIEFLHRILYLAQWSRIFNHPVTELFLKLKYRRIAPVIWMSIIWHVLILALYTTFVIYLYIHICPYNKECKVEDPGNVLPECRRCFEQNWILFWISTALCVIWLAMVLFDLPPVFKSIVEQIRFLVKREFKKTISSFQVKAVFMTAYYIMMPITVWPGFVSDYTILVKNTSLYPVPALGIWVVWSMFILELEKVTPHAWFPNFAVYIVMFKKVSVKVILLATLFLPLLAGFTLGFYVMQASNINSEFSYVTLIGVMLGGPDFKEFFGEEEYRNTTLIYRAFAVIIFILFVILMCVVFINYLLGLTISDVQALWNESIIDSKVGHVRFIYVCEKRVNWIRNRVRLFSPANTEKRELTFQIRVVKDPYDIHRELIEKLKQLSIKTSCTAHEVPPRNLQPKRKILSPLDGIKASLESQIELQRKHFQELKTQIENLANTMDHSSNRY